MKKITMFLGAFVFASAANAATDFQVASQLLSAAKAGDIQYVQILVNAGADVNFVDSTGLSVVCTAIMNNDMRGAQILQMYGADASKCDQQIKNYKNKLPKEESGGLFSGLSNAQSIALAAGGAAIVAGGIYGLTKLLGGSGGGGGGGGNQGTCRPGGACKCADGSNGTCQSNGVCGSCGAGGGTGGATEWTLGALPVGPAPDYNPDFFSPTDTADVRYKDFQHFNATGTQNYLLMMRGYSPMARGYMGMRTLRYADKTPFPLNNISFNDIVAGGGKPIATALITTNGINPTGSAEDGWMVWAECNGAVGASSGCTSALANSGTVSRKYYNNKITKNGDDMSNWTIDEDTSFDLSGNGTVFNPSATDKESMLAKIVAGWYADGRADGDFLGFMPNGQLIVYRTGGGAGDTDFNNFKAMYMAANLKQAGNAVTDVIANASLVPKMRNTDTTTISDILALTASLSGNNKMAKFLDMLNFYYDNENDTTDAYSPGVYAGLLFAGQGTLYNPMIIMSTGEYEIGTGPGKSLAVQEATLENAAPIYYENLKQKFMSIVAVQLDGTGTSGVSKITDFGSSSTSTNKIHLAAWIDDNGTPDDDTDDHAYGARACGQAGKGTGTVDPWCFAAAGATGEQAVAAAAGAVGATMGAFSYMSTDQIFTLLALTADGPWLGTIDGSATTSELLKSYLEGKYVLPGEYQFRIDNGEDYLSVFAEVFGYGLINLERAVTPGKKLYFYDGNRIVSPGGNAYWRSATTPQLVSRTSFLASSVFGSRNASISVPVFDELASPDGSLNLPRVFENKFSFDNGRRGMYMGDLIVDFETDQTKDATEKDGVMMMNLSFSNSGRVADNMGGVDELSFGFQDKNYKVGARYQRRFSDAKNIIIRGDASNPVLALASSAVTSDASVKFGNWSFGAMAFSGSVTDETLLQNDPIVSNNYEPMRLGWVGGGQSSIGYASKKIAINSALGFVRESDTTLGTYSDGLLNMGGGNTVYLDNVISYAPTEFISFTARGTFARTTTDPSMGVITELSDIDSNSFSFGADVGSFSFMVSRPLAVSSGHMKYATIDYEIVKGDNGYDLDANPYIAHLNLRSDVRETRFSAAYRHRFGDFTTGALGLIYRVNPNHTDQYGNEGIVMFKLNHKLGI